MFVSPVTEEVIFKEPLLIKYQNLRQPMSFLNRNE